LNLRQNPRQSQFYRAQRKITEIDENCKRDRVIWLKSPLISAQATKIAACASRQLSRQHDGPRNLARISRRRKRKRSQIARVIIMQWTRAQLALPAGDAQSRRGDLINS